MARKTYSTEQIITRLRPAEVAFAKGLKTLQVCKKLGIAEQTYYRWRKEYGRFRHQSQAARAGDTDGG